MTDRTHPDSGRIITIGDVIDDLHDEIAQLRGTRKVLWILLGECLPVIDALMQIPGDDDSDAHLNGLAGRINDARIADLEAQLEAIGAGGVSGPLIGQPQAMPDLTALTERGAKAWAGVDAQALREGGASHSANAGEPSAHIKEPYTLAEIKAKIDSNDYSAEMLLQHAMLLLDSVQEDAARYRYLRDGDWREHEKLESVIRLQLNALWDETIDAARKQGEKQ